VTGFREEGMRSHTKEMESIFSVCPGRRSTPQKGDTYFGVNGFTHLRNPRYPPALITSNPVGVPGPGDVQSRRVSAIRVFYLHRESWQFQLSLAAGEATKRTRMGGVSQPLHLGKGYQRPARNLPHFSLAADETRQKSPSNHALPFPRPAPVRTTLQPHNQSNQRLEI
jgi:hypothetical protein